MKERSILQTASMVHAILRNDKTMTRRLRGLEKINQKPDDWQFEWMDYSCDKPWRFTQISTLNKKSLDEKTFNQEAIKCPYGQPGDTLWVRETCFPVIDLDNEIIWLYRADGEYEEIRNNREKSNWVPSIYMPQIASRIFLEIVNITVERLRDISKEDAIREGIEVRFAQEDPHMPLYKFYPCKDLRDNTYIEEDPVISFYSLWCSINGHESWKKNPWVWVIEFKRISYIYYKK